MTATRPARPAWSDDDVEAFRDLAHSLPRQGVRAARGALGRAAARRPRDLEQGGRAGPAVPVDPRGVRRRGRHVRARGRAGRGAGPRDGAEPRHRGAQHDRRPLPELLRHRGAEAALAAAAGHRRARRRGRDDRARHRLGPAERHDQGDPGRRRVRHRRLEDVHLQRLAGRLGHRRRQDRPRQPRRRHLADRASRPARSRASPAAGC